MKRVLTIVESIIVSLILTFVLAELLSLYHFGTLPTVLTIIYLISLFCIFEYLILLANFIVNKKKKHQTISHRNIFSMILFFLSLLLVLYFIFTTNIDWLNYYSRGDSAPFYLIIIVNGIKILIPSVISFILGIFISKKVKQ